MNNYELLFQEFQKNEISLTKFCKQNNISRKWFTEYIKLKGFKITNKQNETKFNECIFDSIDTEEKAYWLGFIFADGYISFKRYNFEISLALQDIDHLYKFNTFMSHHKNNVKRDHFRCRWSVCNKHLWETLNNLGCVPNKSLILQFPNISIFKNVDLIRHFIRGYVDGDGCISWKDKNHTKYTLSILGTKQFLESINLQLPNLMYLYKPKNKSVYELKSTQKTLMSILNYLYKDSTIYLQRKYDRYLSAVQLSN